MSRLSNIRKKEKKKLKLGMPQGTAANRLRKTLLFHLVCKLNLNNCHQCKEKIKTEEEFSIEHKEPYLNSENPVEKYFDMNNIAFSHHKCNIGARSSSRKPKHGTATMYGAPYKCRCDLCREYRRNRWKKFQN